MIFNSVILSIAATVVLTACAKQASYTLYQTGRPLGVDTNNARMITANSWGFELNYIGTNGSSIGEQIRFNDSVNKMITKEFGENWQDAFIKESKDELIIDTEIRKLVRATKLFEKSENDLFEATILLEKNENNYLAHIVGQQKSDDSRTFITYAQLFVKIDGTVTLKSDKIKPLTISLPLNGIE